MEKKKISLKEIGLPKLIMLGMVGVLLIILSFPNVFQAKDKDLNQTNTNISASTQNDSNTTSHDGNKYVVELENKLKTVLKKVSGIGDVEVMIHLKASKEQITLKDSPYTQESLNEIDGEGGSRTNSSVKREESTVMVTAEDGSVVPYIIQELEPEVEGVIVVAQGGDDPKIKTDIIDAVVVIFDVPIHKVKVMEMNNDIK